MATVASRAPTIEPKVSVSEYLDREWAADESGGRKSEFVDGEIREMTGASRAHNLITWNIGGLLRAALKGRPFEAYIGDMRVRAEAGGPYYYPDVAIAPDSPKIESDRGATLLNPVVIFEVLSSSTEAIDRGEKLANYGKIATLSDYVLVSQGEMRVDHCARQPDGSWHVVILSKPDQTLSLASIGVELPFAEIYDRVIPANSEG